MPDLCRYDNLDSAKILIWDVSHGWFGLGNNGPWWRGLYKLALISGRIPFMRFSEVRPPWLHRSVLRSPLACISGLRSFFTRSHFIGGIRTQIQPVFPTTSLNPSTHQKQCELHQRQCVWR